MSNDYAVALGWPAARVLILDEDQGQSGASAQGRHGFQVYDASDPHDRLLLGVKGTISEVELHTMRQRLERGRLHKGQRGALFHGVPMGYVLLPTGDVDRDPDAQARAVIQLLFEQFETLGSLYGVFHSLVRHPIGLPIRARTGPQKGQLQWRRPSLATLNQGLHHPIYAGAYAYGRRPVDPQGAYTGHPARRHTWLPMDQWAVLMQQPLPASITWEQYLKNQERLKQNQSGPDTQGAPREGVALLAGVFVCGTCGRRMHVSYRRTHQPYYNCLRHFVEATDPSCPGVQAAVLDTCVAQQVRHALEPAA